MLISLVLFAGVTVAPHPPKKQKFIYHRQCYMRFLSSNSQILFIMMKYSIPGHSCVQEVDNMHRQVQDVMRISEFYSPLLLESQQSQQKPTLAGDDYMNSAKLLRFPTIHFLKFINFAFQETAFITFNSKFCKVAKNSKQQMCFSVYQFKKGRAPQLYQLK